MTTSIRSTAAVVVAIIATIGALIGTATPGAAERTYVGQATCMSSGCHEGAYGDSSDYQGAEAFRATLHQKVHFRPSPETVIIERFFEGDSTLRFVISQVSEPGMDTLLVDLWKSDDGADYFAQMRISNSADATPAMKIEYTFGGYGWAQRYLVRVGQNFHVLPFQAALPAYREHTDTASAYAFVDVNRWMRVEGGVASFADQNTASFRGFSWDRDCAACHVNGFNLNSVDQGAERIYSATWVGRAEEDSALIDENMRVGCESCHGPGSEHAEAPTKANIIAPAAWGNTSEGTDLKLDLCNACHTRGHSTSGTFHYAFDEANQRPYVPGQPLVPFFRLKFSDMITWSDRLTSLGHHQTGQDLWRSKHYSSHVFSNGCWDCHTVHTTGANGLPYQLKKNYYSLADGEGCLSCHGSTGAQQVPALENMALTEMYDGRLVNSHTKHSAEASQCVACHMTRTATVSSINLPRKPAYELPRHDFKVSRPSMTLEYRNDFIGMMNTCALSCHRNGRGSHNFADSTPMAPDFGIFDRNAGAWRESTDLALADSLWFHYRIMYEKYVRASVESAEPSIATAITSIAPNPLRTESRITFTVGAGGSASLDVYDTRGTFVRSLAAGRHATGTYGVNWNGATEAGERLPSGAYVVRLRIGDITSSRTIIVERP